MDAYRLFCIDLINKRVGGSTVPGWAEEPQKYEGITNERGSIANGIIGGRIREDDPVIVGAAEMNAPGIYVI